MTSYAHELRAGSSDHVPFEIFELFYNDIHSHVEESYSTIQYVFEDLVETTYRLGRLPVSTIPTKRQLLNTYRSTECPDWSVDVYRNCPVVPIPLQLQQYIHRRVDKTELCIHWIVSMNNRQYHLIKSGTGRTKHDASVAVPTFRIMVTTDSIGPDHDLLSVLEKANGAGSNNLRTHPPKLKSNPKSPVSVDSPVTRLYVTPVSKSE